MNFLIKIEDAVNRFLEKLFEKLKAHTPLFIFGLISFFQHLPENLKKILHDYMPKVRLIGLKCVGYTEHYTTMIRGHFISLNMYLRSEEFKKADKTKLLFAPFRYAKANPFRALTSVFAFCFLIGSGMIIFQNTEKIVVGTKALRKPASFEAPKEDVFIEFKNRKFEVKGGASAGGHGGGKEAASEEHEEELFLDVTIEAQNEKEKIFLEEMEEMLDDDLEALELPVAQLPLALENQKKIEEMMVKSLNEDFRKIGHDNPIKAINIKQVLPGRPSYYRQAERMLTIEDVNLQLFLEDTHRNKQVWIDFSILASNRNVILYLKEHEVELKDHISTNVEPIIPQLPVEDEGRLIIKDKLKSEINQFLEKNQIEGNVLEIYIDYLLVS